MPFFGSVPLSADFEAVFAGADEHYRQAAEEEEQLRFHPMAGKSFNHWSGRIKPVETIAKCMPQHNGPKHEAGD